MIYKYSIDFQYLQLYFLLRALYINSYTRQAVPSLSEHISKLIPKRTKCLLGIIHKRKVTIVVSHKNNFCIKRLMFSLRDRDRNKKKSC